MVLMGKRRLIGSLARVGDGNIKMILKEMWPVVGWIYLVQDM